MTRLVESSNISMKNGEISNHISTTSQDDQENEMAQTQKERRSTRAIN